MVHTLKTLQKACKQQWGANYRNGDHYWDMFRMFIELWGNRFWREYEYQEMVYGGVRNGRFLPFVLSDVRGRLEYERKKRTGDNGSSSPNRSRGW